jgi:glycosyltransferase involved in cell wall biosynthesis
MMSDASESSILAVGLPIDPNFGWGNYGLNLVLQLLRMPDIHPILLSDSGIERVVNPLHRHLLQPLLELPQRLERLAVGGQSLKLSIPIIHLVRRTFKPAQAHMQSDRQVATQFIEDTAISKGMLQNARDYELIIAGSTWNHELLKSNDIPSVTVPQGIDPTMFHPAPPGDSLPGCFVVFSGGKVEYRKGQDLVIAAFRRFREKYHDAILLTAWHNLWPATMRGIDQPGHVKDVPQIDSQQRVMVTKWLVENGVPADACVDLGAVPHDSMPRILRESHVALFPNRCESGTNLVAMEALACGVPTILSANTGHLDLIDKGHCYPLTDQRPLEPPEFIHGVDGWGESDVDEIVERLEEVYQNRDEASRKGRAAAAFMLDWTWEKQIRRLCDVIFDAGILTRTQVD